MYIPNLQGLLTAGLALTGGLVSKHKDKDVIASGSVLDYTPEKCIDDDGNTHCSKPFLVSKSKCVTFEWSTEGVVSHTTLEVRDAGSNELVFYKDINGDWTPEKGELVYLDFKPKIAGQKNKMVDYEVRTCA